VDAVVHLAAVVGVGQSVYAIADYTSTNNLGTAVLLEALAERPVGRLVVASSMSIYGEGRYVDGAGRAVDRAERTRSQLERRAWDPQAPDGQSLQPVPTPEDKAPSLSSVYALSKYDQERLCLILGQAHRRPTVALRFFNVYGPRQALSNPYTGVLAVFAARLLNGKRPLVFEDGRQRRDFVHVTDVARACRLALERPEVDGEVLNVGSGRPVSIGELAERIAAAVGRPDLAPEITGRYRAGDIRHCFADIGRAQRVLGYEPAVRLEDGVRELATWLADQEAEDPTERAHAELQARGLTL
jgi:dTDP-L-rhamnose 4-epimerase